MEQWQRTLTASERRLLGAWERHWRGQRASLLLRVLAASLIVCGVLCGLTLLASDAPWRVVVGFWGGLALVFTVWIGLEERRVIARRIEAYRGALARNEAHVTRIRSDAVAELQPTDDEGPWYAFQLPNDQLVFVGGQEFEEMPRFPCTDFSIVEILGADDSVIESRVCRKGEALTPIIRIGRAATRKLDVPEFLEVIPGRAGAVEDAITAHP